MSAQSTLLYERLSLRGVRIRRSRLSVRARKPPLVTNRTPSLAKGVGMAQEMT